MNSLSYKVSLRYGRSNSVFSPCTTGRIWAQRCLASRAVVATSAATPNQSMSSVPLTPTVKHDVKLNQHQPPVSSQPLSTHAYNTPHQSAPLKLDLSDARTAYQYKSNWELARAYLVFQTCQMPFLVNHTESLLGISRAILGGRITDALMKTTFFGHFCAGEDEERILPVIKNLAKANIGGIFDYAAESDVGHGKKKDNKAKVEESTTTDIFPILKEDPPRPVARVYDYESEARCDQHLEVFKHCIQSVQNVSYNGFAAIKITALGNPELLLRLSTAIVEAKKLFAKFDVNQDGFITKDEFASAYEYFFVDAHRTFDEMMEVLDPEHKGKVDYITWSKFIGPRDLPRITKHCRSFGPLYSATPTEEELELMEAMFARGHKLAEEAARCGTRLLIDAEQTRFQPAIDNLVLELQQKYNATTERDNPLIYNTYQCYLKDAPERLRRDVERSERFAYHFGAKLVRGAYMEGERTYAKARGEESPIHETLEDTHHCYNDSIHFLLEKSVAPSDTKIEFMCATHNKESIEVAAKLMDELGLRPDSSNVYFAQLYGMADNLTYNLGKNGYHVYKYVPYGQVKEVMPYLLRRAQENSAMMGSAKHELSLLRTEMSRRMSLFAA